MLLLSRGGDYSHETALATPPPDAHDRRHMRGQRARCQNGTSKSARPPSAPQTANVSSNSRPLQPSMSTWRRASTRRSTIRGRSRYATSLRGRGSFARHNLTVVPQIDDALKLFQAALKLHAQGPRSYEEASEAYDTLFASAIFKYPEASTEYERAERQPDPVLALETSFTEALEAANAEADGSGSSLPQALYLAYKNHGQFALDRIRHRVRRAVPQPPALFEARRPWRTRTKLWMTSTPPSIATPPMPSCGGGRQELPLSSRARASRGTASRPPSNLTMTPRLLRLSRPP